MKDMLKTILLIVLIVLISACSFIFGYNAGYTRSFEEQIALQIWGKK